MIKSCPRNPRCLVLKTVKLVFASSVLFSLTFLFGVSTAHAKNPPGAQSGTVNWTCQAFYLPARSIWKRMVAIEYDADGVRSVAIDGVPVYTYSLLDTSVLTAIDGERIQFDAAAQTWTSDLRGVVSSQGRCER
jgi:hypothetical protein